MPMSMMPLPMSGSPPVLHCPAPDPTRILSPKSDMAIPAFQRGAQRAAG